jgi:hypothetical protein
VKGEIMLRTVFCALAVLAICAGVVVADDSKRDRAKNEKGLHAMFVKADMTKNTITFKIMDKTGKNVERTLALAKDARILGEDNKPETFAVFAKNLRDEKDKSILVVEDRGGKYIIELRDLPGR